MPKQKFPRIENDMCTVNPYFVNAEKKKANITKNENISSKCNYKC